MVNWQLKYKPYSNPYTEAICDINEIESGMYVPMYNMGNKSALCIELHL